MSTETPRCSEFARSIGVLPPGTGLFLRRVILVSVPLPWPKPALNHPVLRAAAASANTSDVPCRLFAAEPFATESATRLDVEGVVVEVYERTGPAARLYQWTVASHDSVELLIAAIAATPLGELASIEVAATNLVVAGDAPPPTFLVCTQGSHDMCCGTSGVALADEIAATRSDYIVRRVSHTGGHRFSPTFMAFPEGRMWAFADLELVDRIATDSASANDHRQLARGWWGAKVGAAQVAECAVRAERADQPFVEPLIEPIVEPVVEPATATATTTGSSVLRSPTQFSVTAGDDSWLLDVRVGRNIPTIACEAPGGLPVKPGREFAWSIKRR